MTLRVIAKLFLILVLLGGISFYISCSPPIPDPPGVKQKRELTQEQLQQILEWRNVGNAQLENHQWEAAAQYFSQIAELLPREVLPLRNRSIALVEQFLTLDSSAATSAVEQLKECLSTLQKYAKLAPTDPVSWRLEAQLLVKQGKIEAALERLRNASNLAPSDPRIWYQIYTVSEAASHPASLAIGRQALKHVQELAPENLFAFIRWMTLEDPAAPRNEQQLQEVLNHLESLISPLADGIEKRSGFNVLMLLERAQQQLSAGNLAASKAALMPIRNILTPDDATQSDRKRLEQQNLDFIEFNFSTELERKLASLRYPDEEQNLDVRFELKPIPFPDSDPILQVELADLTLDGKLELVILTERSLMVLSTFDNWETWYPVTSLDLNESWRGFMLADLDQVRLALEPGDSTETAIRRTSVLDLMLYGAAGVQLYKTHLTKPGGKLHFEHRPLAEPMAAMMNVTKVVPADLNNDGDLDLAVLTDGHLQYWNNLGNFQFREEPLGDHPHRARIVDFVVVDWNRDVMIDIMVLLSDGTLECLESNRQGTFRWVDLQRRSRVGTPRVLEFADFSQNGSWDLLIAGSNGIEVHQTELNSTGKVSFKGTILFTPQPTNHVLLFDFNNDGLLDVFASGNTGARLYRGEPLGLFVSHENFLPNPSPMINSAAIGDLNADGDDDLIIAVGNRLQRVLNIGGNRHHWIDVALLAAHIEDKGGADSQRINAYGIGSSIELRVKDRYQLRSVRKGKTRFGLGSSTTADAIRVIWTNGIPQNIVQPAVDQLVWEPQKLTGCCPYLYAWNGERFEFVTDLLWAAPLGLQSPQGGLVPTRPWEYIKIPGTALKPRDGKYVLQVTEELWETAYFDQISLIAVDFPEAFEMVSNEKVGPPELAEYRLHFVQHPQSPVSVTNQSGEDLLPQVLKQDGVYARPFDGKLMQGYTSDSYLEIDFGLQAPPPQLTLFLTGWLRPTDTALNVAIYENPELPGPAPPSIQVPNANGEFETVLPFIGFPGGKTKTIAVDLSGIFLTNDYRIRLSTSLELYWDNIFYSTERLPDPSQRQTLTCSQAHLHYRGVSAIEPGKHNGPERFHYDQVHTPPAWPEISGAFTRYGDVTPLLTQSDHRLVVMGSGDELTLSFDPPETPVPAGWKREFILHCVGWDKDANLHTLYGQTTEPLPFVGMESYPYLDPPPHPVDYLQTYQTRTMPAGRFRTYFRSLPVKKLPPAFLNQAASAPRSSLNP